MQLRQVAQRGWAARVGLTTLALVVAQTPAAAPAWAQPETVEAQSPAQQAQALFKEGAAQYKMSNYAVSLEKFSQAFVLSLEIQDADLRRKVLHALQFNLARAHVKTYKLDQELMHLRQAVDLLENYLEDGADLGIELEADSLIAVAKAELARRESLASAAAPQPANSGSEGAGEEAAVEEVAAPAPGPGEEAGRDRGPNKAGKPLTVAGYTSLGMSVAGVGLMVGGIMMGKAAGDDHETAGTKTDVDDADRRGKLGNTLTIAGAAAAGVFAAAGVTLVVLGKRRSKQAGRSTARLWMSPAAGVRLTGIQLGGRF